MDKLPPISPNRALNGVFLLTLCNLALTAISDGTFLFSLQERTVNKKLSDSLSVCFWYFLGPSFNLSGDGLVACQCHTEQNG